MQSGPSANWPRRNGWGLFSFARGGEITRVPFEMTDHPRNFACPECHARYKVVRMRTEPGASYPTLQCIVCREPLASTEGDRILKYFLIGGPKRA
jgi:hypothetical protein